MVLLGSIMKWYVFVLVANITLINNFLMCLEMIRKIKSHCPMWLPIFKHSISTETGFLVITYCFLIFDRGNRGWSIVAKLFYRLSFGWGLWKRSINILFTLASTQFSYSTLWVIWNGLLQLSSSKQHCWDIKIFYLVIILNDF